MIVKPSPFKKLVAVYNNKLISISPRVLRKPLNRDEQDECLTKGSICIVCNFSFYENKLTWSDNVSAICHPFKDADIFPSSKPTYLFSESDFCDKITTCCREKDGVWKGKYDFVYFTLDDDQGIRSKGLYMLPMMDRVSHKMGMKGVMIAYSKSASKKLRGTVFAEAYQKIKKDYANLKNIDIISNHFDSKEVCDIMMSTKFVLFPNTADASPRLLAESIVRGVPVVVNTSIYGGWKYIQPDNGRFFNGISIEKYLGNKDTSNEEKSLEIAISEVVSIDRTKVADSFYREWGFVNSSIKLAHIINKYNHTSYKAVSFEEWEDQLRASFVGRKQ